jgi:hypothetical protein
VKSYHFSCLAFCVSVAGVVSSVAKAETYVSRFASCSIVGTRQNLDSTVTPLAGALSTNLKITFSSETKQIFRLETSKWKSNLSTPIPPALSARLDSAPLSGTIYTYRPTFPFGGNPSQEPFFNIKLSGLQPADLVDFLNYLGAQIDLHDPWVIPEKLAGRVFVPGVQGDHNEPIHYPFDLAIRSAGMTQSFFSNWSDGIGFEVVDFQFHLPPTVQDGLSYHLRFECSGTLAGPVWAQ